MLAARYPTSGPQAGALEIAEIDPPTPGPGEVLVRIAVSGVNPTDVKARERLDGSSPWPDITPNQDGAGTIEAVGDGVPRRAWASPTSPPTTPCAPTGRSTARTC